MPKKPPIPMGARKTKAPPVSADNSFTVDKGRPQEKVSFATVSEAEARRLALGQWSG